MIQKKNENGSVRVNSNVYVDIAGAAASNCFGVKGMAARSVQDGLFHLLRKESMGKGVSVEFHGDDSITIDLRVDPEDMGKVIGKQGRIGKAMRTVVKAAATRENKKVSVEIE